MASLKETKERIASVKSTLKITSAMKMVASAKLRKAQNAIESMTPYEQKLQGILQELLLALKEAASMAPQPGSSAAAIVAFASNSSLCGAFNANVIRETKARIAQLRAEGVADITVYSIGKRMADAMRSAGYPSPADYSELLSHQSPEKTTDFAIGLVDAFKAGRYARVELIYNHFVTTSTQKVTDEVYLPMSICPSGASSSEDSSSGAFSADVFSQEDDDCIVEPGKKELLDVLLPHVLALRVWTTILDTTAAEHAARTVAMQTATDNAENLLQELTLEYNKGRQQKITSEILDLVGGSQR